MGQIEIYEHLRKKRLQGVNSYFTARQVQLELSEQGLSKGALWNVLSDLLSLEKHRYLEAEVQGPVGHWVRAFRLKDKYIKN
jgi:hypothetical protein